MKFMSAEEIAKTLRPVAEEQGLTLCSVEAKSGKDHFQISETKQSDPQITVGFVKMRERKQHG